ncbi:MAG: glycosyltransferase family 4 protein [Verrucomicrobiae bacterium]|nr:glycosyltransferase family 4 protein [Verrucomicrobiae bacterium]
MHKVNEVEILYSAAHGQFPDTEPLGGGKTVADHLEREHPDWVMLTPRSLQLSLERPLTEMTVRQYARFCRQFERATTEAILQRRPAGCVVLSNDICEGPDFRRLGGLGYRIATIFHVDAVEYFTKFYLRGWIRPERLACFRWDRRWVPDVLRLVFAKQEDCVRFSRRIIVPSEPMREVIVRCYPWCPAKKIVVIPWGNIAPPVPAEPLDIPEDEFVIVTLSRLSPEKGIERLLRALRYVRIPRLRVFICGAAAYMRGRAYERRLRRLASGLPVTFTGHVTGARKSALLRRADLFVSPSQHESYGLTIAEALAHGCRVISHAHYGARGKVVNCADPRALAEEIEATALVRTPRHVFSEPPVAAWQVATVLAELAEK